ncbi:hypothetical protein [Flavobacterium sp. HSC-61S13]|uniref:hypothetical protein n=1 Tax=Flavobacterium sp. HSC-61S13 TaxID=2910963 RepID=UPI00209CD9EA|nr:hypothetical protein [Flavobacterium sp. HSC-61S13]MCP1996426.1 hypothetical protein [Flavobacterium sp. HSC-61S13]
MEIKTFWTIIIKLIGLWILFSGFEIIPQFTMTISFVQGEVNTAALLYTWFIMISVLIIYAFLIYVFLFRSQWIIQVLKLEKNFNEARIDVNIKSTAVLKIAVIVMGGVLLADNVPHFLSRLLTFFQQSEQLKDYRESSWLAYYFIKLMIGLLLLTNAKAVTKYIDKESVSD